MRKFFKFSTIAFSLVATAAVAQTGDFNNTPRVAGGGTGDESVANYMFQQLTKATLVDVDAASTTRVYGGRPAEAGAWPAQVGLHFARKITNQRKSLFKSQFCGGSIISRQWILTAAHCVVSRGKVLKPSDIIVRTGSVLMDQGDLRKVIQITPHEKYDGIIFNNDIALLKLARPIGNSVGPVGAISVAKQGARLPTGPAVAIGWGLTEKNQIPQNLLETDIDIVANETCNRGIRPIYARNLGNQLMQFGHTARVPEATLAKAYKTLTGAIGNIVNKNMICAGVPSGQKTTCRGDSGGPLMIKQPNGKWLQVGVVSWGIMRSLKRGGTKCGIEKTYATYTRLSNYFNWISGHVRGQ